MKKLFTGMLALGVLMMGMASLAQAAGNISATDPVFSSTNVSTTSLNGLTVTIYKPMTNTAIANGATPTTALIPSAVRGSLSYNAGAVLLPDLGTMGVTVPANSSFNNASLQGIANSYYGLFTVTTSTAGTAAIKANTTWASKIDTGSFQDLFTPGPMAFNTNTAKFLLTSYVVPGNLLHAYNPSQLAVYKFIPNVAGVNNANSVQRYTMRTSTANITGTTDGEVWFTTDAAGVSLQNANSAFSTASTTSYYMWVVLKDGGSFDLDGLQNGVVIDPPTVSPAPSGGDSDSGCVYNPAAGFSLEWLLLVLPALGAVVARIRRK